MTTTNIEVGDTADVVFIENINPTISSVRKCCVLAKLKTCVYDIFLVCTENKEFLGNAKHVGAGCLVCLEISEYDSDLLNFTLLSYKRHNRTNSEEL